MNSASQSAVTPRAGENRRKSSVKRILKKKIRHIKSHLEKEYSGNQHAVFWEGNQEASKIGIYLRGGCDLPAVFTAVPAIKKILNGTVAIRRIGTAADSHTHLQLQALQPLSKELYQPVSEKLNFAAHYFKPILFEPDFIVSGPGGQDKFQKNVIIFSIAPDIVRSLYRHKEHELLVDPGGYWLGRSMDNVKADMKTMLWFKRNFTSMGFVDVESFSSNLTKIVTELKQRMDAAILILNVLTVEPGDRTHNYLLQKSPYELRRREFCYALAELSRNLDFSIIDVDRTLKRAGLRESQIDFAHYPDEVYPYIGQEVFRVMQAHEIFKG